MKQPLLVQQGEKELLPDWHWDNYIMGFAKPIEQIFIKLSRYIYVSKRYYTRIDNDENIMANEHSITI